METIQAIEQRIVDVERFFISPHTPQSGMAAYDELCSLLDLLLEMDGWDCPKVQHRSNVIYERLRKLHSETIVHVVRTDTRPSAAFGSQDFYTNDP